jgi:hypothetical protein
MVSEDRLKVRFVLGDRGVLYTEGDLTSMRVPISSSVALYLNRSDTPSLGISESNALSHEVANVNLEIAALARQWLVEDKSMLELLKTQVGIKPLTTI